MTATPRLFKDSEKKKAEADDAVLCSMDDPELYGAEFYRLDFGAAVEQNLLSDMPANLQLQVTTARN